ncbi:MAG: RNA-binding S4 domain-containing protein [Clostridia bacterium]|nr:RNA-binding S4 domain-containing protein [Clostridia bacterium]
MRLDKYLKVSRIIKRRTVANEACDAGRVSVNGKAAKPSAEVAVGDVLEIRMGARLLRVRVTNTSEHATKASAADMYEALP